MSNIKIEDITAPSKRAGGRPQSEIRVNGKIEGARCLHCDKIVKNLGVRRMANHIKRCTQEANDNEYSDDDYSEDIPIEGWNLYGFEKVDGPKGKCLARCKKCGNTLKNTSLIRMANHHKRCSCSQSQKVVVTKDDTEPEEQMIETVVWETNNENVEQEYLNEAATTAELEIIQEDIKRHRKSTSSKPHVNFQVVDAHLSSFLIGCNLTFDVIDSSHFKKFVTALNPNYVIPSSTQLKARVISQLQNVDSSGRNPSKKRRHYDSSYSESD